MGWFVWSHSFKLIVLKCSHVAHLIFCKHLVYLELLRDWGKDVHMQSRILSSTHSMKLKVRSEVKLTCSIKLGKFQADSISRFQDIACSLFSLLILVFKLWLSLNMNTFRNLTTKVTSGARFSVKILVTD